MGIAGATEEALKKLKNVERGAEKKRKCKVREKNENVLNLAASTQGFLGSNMAWQHSQSRVHLAS